MGCTKIFVIFLFISTMVVTGFSQESIPDTTVKTLDGKSVNLRDYTNNGKITVLAFWATWCSPCKKQLNAIADIYEDWQDEFDVQLIAVSIDDARGLSSAKIYVKNKGWDYIVLSDIDSDLKKAMGVNNVPHTFIIDPEGKIVYTHNNYAPGDEDEYYEYFEEISEK